MSTPTSVRLLRKLLLQDGGRHGIGWDLSERQHTRKKPKSLIELGFLGFLGTRWNQLECVNGGAGGN
jgi:hypothetical protein